MHRSGLSLLLCLLVLIAGCAGGPPATPTQSETTPTPTQSQTTAPPTSSPTPTVQLSNATAGERAIAAEKQRISAETSDWEDLTDLSFGILRPATYSVVNRTESGVLVSVQVGYSMEFACGPSDDPTDAVDGAATETRYLVSPEETRLVSVQQELYPGGERFCA
ncbi:hypothetical protein [Salinirubrum litoreum]|uniref:Uncharacterized protein n=1 Tax=Salinirubrum litoreum TaxID=1126234 RepID=A0ABD5RCZ9_9EURY|nr:hypothetical protein [Salinirubrum litoreum]